MHFSRLCCSFLGVISSVSCRSRNLDSHLENITNTYGWDPRVGAHGQPWWWYRFETLGPVGPTCKAFELFGEGDGEKFTCGLSTVTRGEVRTSCAGRPARGPVLFGRVYPLHM